MTLPDAGTVTDHGTVPPSWGRSVDDLIEYVGPLGVFHAGGFTPEPGAPAPATGMVVTLLPVDEAALLPEGLDEDVSYYLSTDSGLALFTDPGLSEAISLPGGFANALPPDGPAIELHYTWLDQWEAVQQFRRTQEPPQVLPPSVYIDATPLGLLIGAIAQAFDYPLWGSDASAIGFWLGLHYPYGIETANSYSEAIACGLGLLLLGRGSTGRFADVIRPLGVRIGFGVVTRAEAPPDPTQASSWLTHDLWNTGSPSGDIGLLEQWLLVEPTPPVPPPPPQGITWVEADLFNVGAIADENDAFGMVHHYLGVEREAEPPPPPPPPPPPDLRLGATWVESDLWNTSVIADEQGGWGVLHSSLGVEAIDGPPHAVRECFTRVGHRAWGFDSGFHVRSGISLTLETVPAPGAGLAVSEQLEAPVAPLAGLGVGLPYAALGFSRRDRASFGYAIQLRGEGADPSDIDVGDLFDSADLWGTPERVTATLFS